MKMKQTGKVGRKLLSLALALALMAGFAPGMGMTAWADTALPADGSDAGNGLSYYVGYDMVQQGGTYEAADDNKGGASLFDRNPATKACIGFVGSYSVEFSYASEITPHNYYFRTGDDTSTQTARNPSAWKLEGKNTDNTWTVLDEKSKQTYTTDRNTEVKFGISNNTAYQTFRLTITANSSGRDDWPIGGKPTFQLSEFYMSGTIAPASSVASVTSGGTTTNYTDFASAVTAWNSAASGATLTLLADVTMANTINVSGTKILDLNGYGIKKTGSGRVLMVTNGANMTLHDSNATRTDTGANRPDGVSGGYITGGNTRNESGSCVRVESGSAFNMYGGTITGNTLENGGGAVLVIGGNFNMYGGIITGNKADNNCGGVWVHSKKGSTFNMYCGTITDNTLYDVNAQGVMTTSSNATIGDFDYSEYVAVTFDANGGTGSMPLQKVRKNTDTTIFANVNCSASGISDPAFSREGYDFAGWNTQADGEGTNYTAGTSTINISEATTLYAHWTAHVASVTSDGTTTNYTDFASAVTAWNSAASGATLTLLADVTTITINFSGTKTLDLNGHSLTGNGNGTVIKVNGGSLTVNGKNGTITGGKAVEGGAFFITSNGKVTLNDCTLKGNEATNVGDAFFIKSSGGGGSAIINNCTIIGRGKDKGAALWLQGHNNPDTSFTMNGGSISNFKIGVWVQGKTDLGTSMFTMNGGTISDNLIGVKNEGPNSKIIVSGDAIISNNDQKNLELNDGIKVTVNSALGKNAKIGIYMGNSGVFTNSTPTDYNGATKFTSDNASYAVGKNTDGQLFLGTPINSVAVTDITAPAATEALDTAAATSTEHVTLADSGAITWDPAAPQDGKAAYATEYTATVTATADDNYAFADGATATVNGETATVTKNDDGTLSIAYTFSKTALTPVTITATDKEVTYSADGIAIPVDGMFAITEGAGEATYSVTNGTGEGTFAEGKLTVTKCGTFTVKVSTAATETYAAGTETTATLTVNKADSTAATVTANNRTYDGTEQPLVTVEGEPTGGTMQYALGTETKATEQYTTSIPTATDAGTYYVWYKVVGDDVHLDTDPVCIKVKILNTGMFADIEYGTWKYTAAEAVYDKKIMVGKGMVDGKIIFAPDDKVNRSQLVTSIYAMDGKPAVDYVQQFSDVNENDWFAKAVTWAANNGITAGTGAGQFGVTGNATREQVAVMLYKYAKYCGYDVSISESTTLDGFADADKVHDWALDAVKWAVERKIISGKGSGSNLKIAPEQGATRIECAAMLNKFSEVCTVVVIPDEILEEPLALPMEDIEETPASEDEIEDVIVDEDEEIIDEEDSEVVDEESDVIDEEDSEVADEESEVIDEEESEVTEEDSEAIDEEEAEVIDNQETEE